MKFETIEELTQQCSKVGACPEGLEWLEEQDSLEQVLEDIELDWRLWALRRSYIQFAKHCDWDDLSSYDWACLLRAQPRFAEHCDWNKLAGWSWSRLLRNQPRFAEYCAWNTLDGWAWSSLLRHQPRFAEHCAWDKLNGEAWDYLLGVQPRFAEHRKEWMWIKNCLSLLT